ncbi:MAG: ABC transporter ATP-binding protein [Blastopirellula sp.]|nr:MAG: ABC transporter ATP-binding protein [Blastopirellula sp.]
MEFLIKPYEGVGDVQFGMSVTQVRSFLGSEFESFNRTSESAHPCDYFELIGFFVYYTESGEVEAIEFCSKAVVEFEQKKLFDLSFSELTDLLHKFDQEVEIECDGLTSYQLGIGAYAPLLDEEGTACKPESIIVFERGYYDK